MFEHLSKLLILWMMRRHSRWLKQRVVTFDRQFLFNRFSPFWWDESIHKGKHHNRPPWWRPFNLLLHWWCPAEGTSEAFHDHPRWSITICLRGRMIEKTPWKVRELKPGSIVFRTRKYIHAFELPQGYRGKTWTLFIVGRRNHPQNRYAIIPAGRATHFSEE